MQDVKATGYDSNGLRTLWFGGFLFTCLPGETAQLFPHAPTGRYNGAPSGTGIMGPSGNNSQFGSPRGPISSALGAQALIVRMIDEDRAPTLDELANMLFVSRSHLCSVISCETGQSIGHYAGARRMERTKTMLVGCCSVARAATRLGWTRCSTFSQAFKRSTGVSPIEWRNSNSQ